MITFTRTETALPGKLFELIALTKEGQSLVKKLTGIEPSLHMVSGGAVGQLVSMMTFDSLAHFEEIGKKLLAEPEYHAILKKDVGLIVPGSAHDQILRSI